MNNSNLILGLDLGVTSVGWALLEATDSYSEPRYLIKGTGVRIFPATTEGTKNEPKNRKRRDSRGSRRMLHRKSQRRRQFRALLTSNQLLPVQGDNIESLFQKLGDPYELRQMGATEKLDLYEIGRALSHLIKRRGFKSNRKSGKSSDDSVVYGSINSIREEMRNSEYLTLGSFLADKAKKRGRYTAREMVEQEFDQLWHSQAAHYPEILTPHLYSELSRTAFYQRPISSQRGLIGKCTFEAGKKRCDMARQDAQRIRFWQDVNNLKLQDRNTLEWRTLTHDERKKLAAALESPKKEKFNDSDLRKCLGIGADIRINIEKNLKGNTTAYKFSKAIGPKWKALTIEQQESLTTDFIRIEDERVLENRLRSFWAFTDLEIAALLKMELESGYSRCSLKAIKKILPKMIEGKRYDEAASEVYGDHRGVRSSSQHPILPPPSSDLRNPIVKKALGEMRKVVNAIISEYGLPSQIRIEMARDLKLNAKQKERVNAQIKKNEAANKEAIAFFTGLHLIDADAISAVNKLKYRLAKECGWICPYTGKPIAPESLLGDQWDIEHIIPYSRCFDDSYMNKTLCESDFNRRVKLNKTPFELFGHDEQKWFELGERIAEFPFAKRNRFIKKEVDTNEMIGRMLSDTRYICREARGYLRQLYPDHADENRYVQVVAGGSTAKLRQAWGINAILSDGDVEYKNRWDHRHHAIDAIVIAMTDRALFQRISKRAGQNEALHRRELKGFEMPWDSFLDDVKQWMDAIAVSHAPTRRVRGQLLEDTAYGRINDSDIFTVRTPVKSLTEAMIKNIADKKVKEIVELRLSQYGGDLKKAFAEPLFHVNGKTPIDTVRRLVKMSKDTVVGIKDRKGKIYKYYAVAGNHHVDIFENPDGERQALLVPRFYAAQRNWKPGDLGPEWNKLFSLCANDYVEFRGDNGELHILRIQKMSGGNRTRIDARPAQDARTEYIPGVSLALTSSEAFKRIIRKLQIDPLGRLTEARD